MLVYPQVVRPDWGPRNQPGVRRSVVFVPSSTGAHVASGTLGERREVGCFPAESRGVNRCAARRAPLASKDILSGRVGAAPVGRRASRGRCGLLWGRLPT